MDQKIFLSIIIPTYKRPDGLTRILQSINMQNVDMSQIEIIVINNSMDTKSECEEICALFIQKRLPVQLLHETVKGTSSAKNLGIKNACGRWLAFFDDDEGLVENYLSTLLPVLQKESATIILGGPYAPVFESPSPKWLKEKYFWVSYGSISQQLSSPDYLPGGNLVISKTMVDQIGGYSTEFGHKGKQSGYGEDTEFVTRAIKNGGVQHYLPSLVVYHYIPSGRLTLNWFKIQKKLSSLAKAKLYLLANPLPPSSSERLKLSRNYLKTAVLYWFKMILWIILEPFRDRHLYRFHENYWIEIILPIYAIYQINLNLYKLIKI
jgi:glycosyltransferase involved in cell wall biosynthesis